MKRTTLIVLLSVAVAGSTNGLSVRDRVIGNFQRKAQNKCITGSSDVVAQFEQVTLQECSFLCGTNNACRSFEISNAAFNNANTKYTCEIRSNSISAGAGTGNCAKDNYERVIPGECEWEELGEPACCNDSKDLLGFRVMGGFSAVGDGVGKCFGGGTKKVVCRGVGESSGDNPCAQTMCQELCRHQSDCLGVEFNLDTSSSTYGKCVTFAEKPTGTDTTSGVRCLSFAGTQAEMRDECIARAQADPRCGRSVSYAGKRNSNSNLGSAEQCTCVRNEAFSANNVIILKPNPPANAFTKVQNGDNRDGVCREKLVSNSHGTLSAQGVFYETYHDTLLECQKDCIHRLGTSCSGVEYNSDVKLCELHYGDLSTIAISNSPITCHKMIAPAEFLKQACEAAAAANSNCADGGTFVEDGFNGMFAGTCFCMKKPPLALVSSQSVITLPGKFTQIGGDKAACRGNTVEDAGQYIQPTCTVEGSRVASEVCTLEQCLQKCREFKDSTGKYNTCTGIEYSSDSRCEVHFGVVALTENKEHSSKCFKWDSQIGSNANFCENLSSAVDCLVDPVKDTATNSCKCNLSIANDAQLCAIEKTSGAGRRRLGSRLRRALMDDDPMETEVLTTTPECGSADGYGLGRVSPSSNVNDEPGRRLSQSLSNPTHEIHGRVAKTRHERLFDLNCGADVVITTPTSSPVENNNTPTASPATGVPSQSPTLAPTAPSVSPTTSPTKSPAIPTPVPTRLPSLPPNEADGPNPDGQSNDDLTLVGIIIGSIAGSLLVGGGGYAYYRRTSAAPAFSGVNSLPKGASANFAIASDKFAGDHGQYIGSYYGKAQFENPSFSPDDCPMERN